MFRALQSRLPDFKEILPVYAVLVFFLFGWATIAFFWKLPAWLFYLNLGEVGVIYSYAAVTEFLESLIYLCFLLALAAILPAQILKNRFQIRGAIAALFILGFIELTSYFIAFRELAPAVSALVALLICGVLGAALLWLSSKFVFFEQAICFAVDRMIIFLYVYMPIAGIAFIVVLIRAAG